MASRPCSTARSSTAELLQSLKEARSTIRTATEAELHKTLRGLDQQLRSIQATDFFPGKASERAAAALETLRREIERHLSPGEPTLGRRPSRSSPSKPFQGKTWVTRKRPWVDRLATAWLVLRFVDPAARFVWFENPGKSPKGAVGFDFDGATFSHVDGKVTFEVVAAHVRPRRGRGAQGNRRPGALHRRRGHPGRRGGWRRGRRARASRPSTRVMTRCSRLRCPSSTSLYAALQVSP